MCYRQLQSYQSAKDKLNERPNCSFFRLLEYATDTAKIRRQDSISTILNVAGNSVGQSLAWDFIRSHWKTFREK